jgi:hypothetical protein
MRIMCIDETYNDKLTVLCGVTFLDGYWRVIEKEINRIKTWYFPFDDPYSFELKSYDIRQKKGVYRHLSDEDWKSLQGDISELLSKLHIKIIAAVIDEEKLKENYAKHEHPYHLAYKFLMERFEMMISSEGHNGIILIDQQANKMGRKKNNTDRKLKDLHHQYRVQGTKYVKFQKLIKSLHVVDSLDSLGVQLADLCVYPIMRKFSSNDKEYDPWNIIKTKLHSRSDGKTEGYGIKFFP